MSRFKSSGIRPRVKEQLARPKPEVQVKARPCQRAPTYVEAGLEIYDEESRSRYRVQRHSTKTGEILGIRYYRYRNEVERATMMRTIKADARARA
jgi:hypothetical protein